MAMSVPAPVVVGVIIVAALVVRLRSSRRYSDGYVAGLTFRAKATQAEK